MIGNKIKNILEGFKFPLMFLIMALGFYAIYWTVWMMIGWPLEWWSIVLLNCLALATEFGYYRWIDS